MRYLNTENDLQIIYCSIAQNFIMQRMNTNKDYMMHINILVLLSNLTRLGLS